jgi:type IV pilus assembly protein PilF
MKLLLLLTLTLLFSCGGHKIKSTIHKDDKDVLAAESFLRFGQGRLKELAGSNDPLIAAVSYCHAGQFQKGFIRLKKSLKQNKKNPNYWNYLGMCYFLKGNLAKADYFFKTAISAKTDFAPAYNNLGMIFLRKKHYQIAYDYFHQALKFKPNARTANFNLAKLYIEFGQYDSALKILTNLYPKGSNDPDILSGLGIVYLFKGEHRKSLSYFNKISKDILTRVDISLYYALSLYENGQYQKAKEILDNKEHTQIRSLRLMERTVRSKVLKALKNSLKKEAS